MMKKSTLAENSEEISSENVNSDDSDISDNQNDFVVEATQASKKSSTKAESLPSYDSDAPVGVSWKDSKAVFEQDKRNRNDAVNFARSVDKAKRRKKNEMFVSQKETKRKLTKLPEDIVQAVVIKKPKQIELDKIEEENKKLERRKASKKSKKKDNKAEEYCHVVILEEEVTKSKKVQETAAEFLKNHLYGNRLERTSGSRQLTMQSKSSGIIKPAVKFNSKV